MMPVILVGLDILLLIASLFIAPLAGLKPLFVGVAIYGVILLVGYYLNIMTGILLAADVVTLLGVAIFVSFKIALGGAIVFAVVIGLGVWKKMLKPMLLMFNTIFVVLLIIANYKYQGYQQFMGMKEGMAHMKQTISTTKATSDDWQTDVQAVGSLRAVKGVDISNELAGTVEEVDFTDGGDVKEGTLLVKLRAEDDIAKLASLQAAAKLAAINLDRDRKQLKVEAVSQANVDSDVANFAGAQALAQQQQALVDKKFIRAPFSGHLGIRNIDVGQYLTPGTAIVTLQQLDPIYLDFTLPQQSFSEIKVGQKLTVKNDTWPNRNFEGTISAINPKVDTNTRNISVRAQLDNADHALLPGMYATAQIAVGSPARFVTLPQTAITYNPYGNTVYIVRHKDELKTAEDSSGAIPDADKDAKKEAPDASKKITYKPIGDKDDDLVVEQSFVTVGETRGDQVQILKGVDEGDIVVSAGQLKLQNGAAITINNAVTPKNDSNPLPQDH